MFGFTGTPIFEENSQSKAGLKLTTDYLFNQCLHQYVIVDAIRDRNVLQFQIDYRGKYTAKGMQNNLDYDEDVEGIDTKELYDNPQRLEMIARYIVDTHDTKTKNREFTAMFCVSSVDTLTQYYELFEKVQAEKQQQDEAEGRLFKPLTIATIFSYGANEAVENNDQNGLIQEESTDTPNQINQSSRDKLDRYIANYNAQFGTNYNSGDGFYAYYRDIADRVKKKQIDILLVVNMFLTGFDSKPLNTLYVDKNLKYHGLIQAFSRTNRVYNDKKPFGNIISFRNLKRATDEALALFSNKEARKTVLVPSFDEIKQDYEQAVEKLLSITPDYQTVDDLSLKMSNLNLSRHSVKSCATTPSYKPSLNMIKTTLSLINSTLRILHLNMLISVERFGKPPKKKKSLCWMMSISNWIYCTVTVSMWVIS
jgi:type I restriction enzyme R subunit